MIYFSDLTEKLNKIKEQTSALSQVISDGTNAINNINNTPDCSDIKDTALEYLKKAVNEIIGEQEEEEETESDSNLDINDDEDEDLDFE